MLLEPSRRAGGAGAGLSRTDLAAPLRAPERGSRPCAHCGSPTESPSGFCCEGCRVVAGVMADAGLGRWYELRGGAIAPASGDASARIDGTWLELQAAELARSGPGLHKLALDVQGISCAACVWVMDELFRRTGARGRALPNPARGELDLWVERDFPLSSYIRDLARLGYAVGPRRAAERGGPDDLLVRVGVTAAIAMNVMIFAIARYAGLDDPATLRLFHLLELGLALAAFGVGGVVFVRGAAVALARGVLHLDLPIALGILLGYAGSIASLVVSGGRDSYLDTLVVFTTLMLLGRFLRERVVARNRARLLDDGGAEGILVRRVSGDGPEGRVSIVPATDVRAGDVLLVAPGDVVPVRGELLDDGASISLEWITGEAEPQSLSRGDAVPAGASVLGGSAARFRAAEALTASALLDLLRTPAPGRDQPGRLERRVAAAWVPFVLFASAVAFGGWLLATSDLAKALSVTVGLLVVTCPCAFGIATPLGHEVVLAELRRRGLLVRTAGFLERAADVAKVVFDKTGTLTTGALRLRDAAPLAALPADELAIAHDLAVRSAHPKSAALAAAIPAEARVFDARRAVVERPGEGVETSERGHVYRLGAPRFASPHAEGGGGDVVFSRDGVALCRCETEEILREDAAAEVAALRAAGLQIWMLTGDAGPRALAVAAAAGIEPERVVAGCSPEGKAAWLRAHDAGDTLFLGDGMNDALAASLATTSGTPAAGRTFLAARTDFYLLGDGLRGVRLALAAARAIRRRTSKNLHLAVAYNALALGVCLGGWMSPLLAAVVMPVSSLLAIGLTLRDLARRGAAWTS